MKTLFLALILTFSSPLLAQEPAGKVIDLAGKSFVARAGGRSTPMLMLMRQDIFLGDTIKTSKTGAVKILFADDTLLTVKENSSVLITTFLFDPAAKKRNVVFQASFGTLRAVVGKFFGKDQPVEIKTTTAVAGIRGTDIGAVAKIRSSSFFCFSCEQKVVAVYNVIFPGQTVNLNTGETIQILKEKAARAQDISPIPQDILDRKEILFDIQKGAVSKAVESSSKETAKEAAKPGPAATTTLNQAGAAAQEKELATEQTQPTTVDTNTTVNPGAKQENTTSPAITITIPH